MFNLFGPKKYENVSAQQFAELMKDKNTALIDVRSPGEFSSGHIPGAKNINLMGANFAQQIEKLDKDKTYLVYCLSGGRSSSACGAMASKGHTKLYNLKGGISNWPGPVKK